MRVLVTRPEPGAALTAERLRQRGHEPLVSPVSVLRPIAADLPHGPFDAVVVSSANALRVLAPDQIERIRPLPVFTVGVATAAVARGLGLEARPGPGTAAALVDRIVPNLPPPASLLYLAGEPRKPVLERMLATAGYRLHVHLCYRMEDAGALAPEALAALAAGRIDAVLHFSQESARRFTGLTDEAGLAGVVRGLRHLCMSPDVAAGVVALSASKVAVAALPTEDDLLSLLDKDD